MPESPAGRRPKDIRERGRGSRPTTAFPTKTRKVTRKVTRDATPVVVNGLPTARETRRTAASSTPPAPQPA